MIKKKILIADDEPRMRLLISDFLSPEYDVIQAEDGQQAIALFEATDPIHLVVLDIMMPYVSGLEVMEHIRKSSRVPILLLTAKNTEMDELTGFISGCDEYIKKPFSPSILRARIQTLIKRIYPDTQALHVGDLVLTLDVTRVTCKQKPLDLSATEFKLLHYMMQNQNITLTREALLNAVWGYDYDGTDRTVDTTINRLRNKLMPGCDYIQTSRGLGYRFEVTV